LETRRARLRGLGALDREHVALAVADRQGVEPLARVRHRGERRRQILRHLHRARLIVADEVDLDVVARRDAGPGADVRADRELRLAGTHRDRARVLDPGDGRPHGDTTPSAKGLHHLGRDDDPGRGRAVQLQHCSECHPATSTVRTILRPRPAPPDRDGGGDPFSRLVPNAP